MQICKFRTPDGKTCSRSIKECWEYCSLDFGYDRNFTDDILDNPHFAADFQAVLAAEDGDWRGFVFPEGIKLPKEIPFKIDARGSRFALFEQSNVIFKEPVDFSGALFKEELKLSGSVFEKSVNFERCQFEGPVSFLNVKCISGASFLRAEFARRTIMRINFFASANFNEAIFREGVNFSGWSHITLKSDARENSDTCSAIGVVGSNPPMLQLIRTRLEQIFKSVSRFAESFQNVLIDKIRKHSKAIQRLFAKVDPNVPFYWVIEGEGHLENVVFMKPDQTSFNQADLSKVYFRGTNLRGVRFLGVKWWQAKLNRNGLYDEVFIRLSKDGPFRHSNMPALEETCRNARVALEENRNFNAAADFYIAEMEAARYQLPFFQRHLFSVNALYRSVSYYGTSVATALRILAFLYILHVTTSVYFELPPRTLPDLPRVLEIALRSAKVLLLATTDPKYVNVSTAQSWLDVALRLLGPIQVAMIAIAFRARIKRH